MHRQSWKDLVISGILAGLVCIIARPAAAEDGQVAGAPVMPADLEPAISSLAQVAEEPSAPQPATPKDPTESLRSALDGTQWTIEWTPLGDGKGKPHKDTVTFTGPKVSSQRLSKAGYPDTNYTLTAQEAQPPVWETMQTKEETGVVFWRGEIHGATMRGVISMHPKEGSPEDFAFSGKQTAGAPLTTALGAPATEPGHPADRRGRRGSPEDAVRGTAPATPSVPSEAQKKKRKSWFGR